MDSEIPHALDCCRGLSAFGRQPAVHVVAAGGEGRWREDGYVWVVNPPTPGDFRVRTWEAIFSARSCDSGRRRGPLAARRWVCLDRQSAKAWRFRNRTAARSSAPSSTPSTPAPTASRATSCATSSPADVKGADYPSETFRVLKQNEIRRFGEYRNARLALQAWDREQEELRKKAS